MFAKVRPVGSLVPEPEHVDTISLPWDDRYTTLFTGSGTEALSMGVQAAIALKAVSGVPEIIIPAYGCPDLISAIVAQNARPVLVDFAMDRPVMDEKGIRRALNPQTVAIVAVNLLGSYERLPQLARICSDKGVILIEDSAQCFPPSSSHHGLADFVILSFGRGKPINLMGGGALLIRRSWPTVVDELRSEYPALPQRSGLMWDVKRLAFNVLLSRYIYPVLENMPFLHIGQTRFRPLGKIRRLELPASLLAGGIKAFYQREPLHLLYSRQLAFIEQSGWKIIGSHNSNDRHPRLRFALLAPDECRRNEAVKKLNENGIGANAFYERVLPDIVDAPAFNHLLAGAYPKATDFASRLVTLPTHEGVTKKDVEVIVSVFKGLTSE